MGTSGTQMDFQKNWKNWSNTIGDSLSSSCFCFSLWDVSLLFHWRSASSTWQETLLSTLLKHFLSSRSWNFYYGWWIKLHFLWWKGRFCYLNWEILSLSRPIYCSLGQGGWSYIRTWTFSQNHLVWLGEEYFQKDGSEVYRKRYIGQIK